MSNEPINNSPRGRPFLPGVSGNPRGRPKGSRNKRTKVLLEAAAAEGEMPIDYMLRIMRDPNAKATRRDEMAKAAAPYLHPRLSAAVVEQDAPSQIVFEISPDDAAL